MINQNLLTSAQGAKVKIPNFFDMFINPSDFTVHQKVLKLLKWQSKLNVRLIRYSQNFNPKLLSLYTNLKHQSNFYINKFTNEA